MAVEGNEGIWSLGDSASIPEPEGGVARRRPSAVRRAPVVAANIAAQSDWGTEDLRLKGQCVLRQPLGRYKAVRQDRRRTFRGFKAWWMARSYHMSQIPGASRAER